MLPSSEKIPSAFGQEGGAYYREVLKCLAAYLARPLHKSFISNLSCVMVRIMPGAVYQQAVGAAGESSTTILV
jgi:hypothetical protein